jgi:hypothetical protein
MLRCFQSWRQSRDALCLFTERIECGPENTDDTLHCGNHFPNSEQFWG